MFNSCFSWPFHVGEASTIGGNVKRQRGSQRSLNKLVATNSNSHGGASLGPMRSNTTDGYYKPKAQVRIRASRLHEVFEHATFFLMKNMTQYIIVHYFLQCETERNFVP
jgi:hypothetical protein